MEYLKVALPKGRMGDLSSELFCASGYEPEGLKEGSRKLIYTDEKNKLKFFLVKPQDVPVYVEHGAADLGISGKDVLLEENRQLYEVLDLGFGKCRMVVAGPANREEEYKSMMSKKIATKFPGIAREYFEHRKNEVVEIIKLNGSVELAPLAGLSDVIVDIVETGSTLRENGLKIFEVIEDISARLVVNRASLKIKQDRINPVIEALRNRLKEV